MPPDIFFRLNTLKGTAKAPAEDLLRLSTRRGTKTAFLTPKRYDELPCPFYTGFAPAPLGSSGVRTSIPEDHRNEVTRTLNPVFYLIYFCIWLLKAFFLMFFHVFDSYIERNGIGIPKRCFLTAGVDPQRPNEHTGSIDKCLAQWPIM